MIDNVQPKDGTAFHHTCWDNREVDGALQLLGSQQTMFLGQLAELLNRYHRWSKPAAYYDLLCGEWLMHFSHVVYAAYLDITRGAVVAPRQFPIFGFSDFYDYQWTAFGRPMFSQQLRHMRSVAWRLAPWKPQLCTPSHRFCKTTNQSKAMA